MAERDLRERLFRLALLAQETTENARSRHAAPHIITFREGEQSAFELLIEDAGLQEDFKEWKKKHDRR